MRRRKRVRICRAEQRAGQERDIQRRFSKFIRALSHGDDLDMPKPQVERRKRRHVVEEAFRREGQQALKQTVGALAIPVEGLGEGSPVVVVVRFYDLKFWRDDAGGFATVVRTTTLGDRVKVEAVIDGGDRIFSQFPRRSSLLRGIEPGCRIHIEVTLARVFPHLESTRPLAPILARAA